jgi:hypothetical protein
MEKYQRKFYSDELTDEIIAGYQKENDAGYSEAARNIILMWAVSANKIPVKGIIKDGKVIMEDK